MLMAYAMRAARRVIEGKNGPWPATMPHEDARRSFRHAAQQSPADDDATTKRPVSRRMPTRSRPLRFARARADALGARG